MSEYVTYPTFSTLAVAHQAEPGPLGSGGAGEVELEPDDVVGLGDAAGRLEDGVEAGLGVLILAGCCCCII